jgi:hypothetical protein
VSLKGGGVGGWGEEEEGSRKGERRREAKKSFPPSMATNMKGFGVFKGE